MELNNADLKYFTSKGISIKDVETQISLLKKGTKYLNLARPARLIDGIIRINPSTLNNLDYSKLIQQKSITKFTPASGAASRMFKDLYRFLDDNEETEFIHKFISNLENFAFYDDLKEILRTNNFEITELLESKDYSTIIEFLIEGKGLSYGLLPKALLKFHRTDTEVLNPIKEHLKEAIAYCGKHPKVSFTISEQFKNIFDSEIQKSINELKHNLEYQLSYQKTDTDTVAVDLEYNLVESNPNEYLIRPGGHGALIENLNDIDSDIIFLKNIDNVCSDTYFSETVKYKKALVSILLSKQEQIYNFARKVAKYDGKDSKFNNEIKTFLEEELNIFSSELCKMEATEKANFFREKLNRPLRICGMVKNEGEPGGGPFWVKDEQGTVALQIVESLQIDHNKPDQEVIFSESTHFNPVDIVCSTKDVNGKKFDFTKFVDKDAVFVTEKTFRGESILALEHPGLWNGGMGNWNSIFVEVSPETFNPVKTVNDLLKKTHQL